MTKFVIGNMPKEVKIAVTKSLMGLYSMIPNWCQRINVNFYSDDTEYACRVYTQYEYRRAEIRVCPAWLDAAKVRRREYLRHELYHVILCPLTDYARDVLDELLKDAPVALRGIIMKRFIDSMEMVIQDLTVK